MAKGPNPKEPKQKRSQETLDRILTATEDLLEKYEFEDMSIAKIAKRAGVAVGTVYTRFATKDDLLPYLIARLQQQQLELAPQLGQSETMKKMGLDERIYFQMKGSAVVITQKKGLLKAIAKRQLLSGGELPKTELANAKKLIGYLSDWLLQCRDEIAHPEPEKAVKAAIYLMTTPLQLHLLFSSPLALLSDQEMVEELARSVIAYLKNDTPLPESMKGKCNG